MASLTEIFNAALAAVGEDQSITDANTDPSKNAALCRARWQFVRDAILRSHKWNCALTRKTLAPDAVKPDWGFENYFTWPADPYCLRILEIEDIGVNYQIEGRKIAADGSTLKILYVARITDTTQFDSLLVDALIDALAAELALPITGKPTFKKSLFDTTYGQGGKLSWARTIDGMEGKSRRNQIRPLIDVRRSGISGDTGGPRVIDNE